MAKKQSTPQHLVVVTYKIYGYALHKRGEYPKLKISIIRQAFDQQAPTFMGNKARLSFLYYYSEFFMTPESGSQPIPEEEIDVVIEGCDEIKRQEVK